MEPTFYQALDVFISAVEGGEEIAYPNLMDGLKAQWIAEAAINRCRRISRSRSTTGNPNTTVQPQRNIVLERHTDWLDRAGRIGKVHAEAISTRAAAELVAVSDVNLPAAEELASKWRVSNVYQDHRLILDNPSVDAVAICSFNRYSRTKIIVEAAQAGKHIFCEKPIDFSLAKIDAACWKLSRKLA